MVGGCNIGRKKEKGAMATLTWKKEITGTKVEENIQKRDSLLSAETFFFHPVLHIFSHICSHSTCLSSCFLFTVASVVHIFSIYFFPHVILFSLCMSSLCSVFCFVSCLFSLTHIATNYSNFCSHVISLQHTKYAACRYNIHTVNGQDIYAFALQNRTLSAVI